LEEIEYLNIMEERAKDLLGNGYCVSQPVRFQQGKETKITITNVEPSSWYPVVPAFTHQEIQEARVIDVFAEENNTGGVEWYALVERHGVGLAEYKLYKLDHKNSLE